MTKKYTSKTELIDKFYINAMPKQSCACKQHMKYWLASQRFFLTRAIRGLPHRGLR